MLHNSETVEIQAIRRALVERWPLTQKKRRWSINRLISIAKGDARYAVAAIRALIAADAVNLKQAELWLAENGPPTQEDDEYIVESDPDIIRLEAELLARKAELRAGNAGRAGLRSDGREMVIAKASDVAQCGNQASGDDAGSTNDSVDATAAR